MSLPMTNSRSNINNIKWEKDEKTILELNQNTEQYEEYIFWCMPIFFVRPQFT